MIIKRKLIALVLAVTTILVIPILVNSQEQDIDWNKFYKKLRLDTREKYEPTIPTTLDKSGTKEKKKYPGWLIESHIISNFKEDNPEFKKVKNEKSAIIKAIRKKYPQSYADLDDYTLWELITKKYSDMPTNQKEERQKNIMGKIKEWIIPVAFLIICLFLAYLIIRVFYKIFKNLNWRKRVLLIGLIIFVLMGLFPPYGGEGRSVKYQILFCPPPYKPSPNGLRIMGKTKEEIDFSRLFLQWGILFVCMSGILVIFKKEKHIEKNSNGQEK